MHHKYSLRSGKKRIFLRRFVLLSAFALFIYIYYRIFISISITDKNMLLRKHALNQREHSLDYVIQNINQSGVMLKLINYVEGINLNISNLKNQIKLLEKEIQANCKDEKYIEKDDFSYCGITSFESHSSCKGKFEWMKEKWSSDKCYAEWGVNGSSCSILRYLSEVESWCPNVPDHHKQTGLQSANAQKESKPLSIRDNFDELYSKLSSNSLFTWVLQRIKRMESKWIKAAHELTAKYTVTKGRKKRILLHAGLLDSNNGWDIAKNAFNGGPLGELVQWSDVISSLYVLGHDIDLTVTANDLNSILQGHLSSIQSENCPISNKLFDLIYTDITGLKSLKKTTSSKFHLFHCNLRILDSFGTEPAYNNPSFAKRKMKKTVWGMWDLNPKQFNTMFPHTPDNTFIGFVVEESNRTEVASKTQNLAVVYGKRDKFWQGKRAYLDVLNESLQLHATAQCDSDTSEYVPSYVINHGVMSGPQLHALLQSARIFVGMGFPYEGPAPLEAIAYGAVFLNPIFKNDSQLYAEANKFFKKKPTSRHLTSQHPYAETFVGHPNVRMVDMEDADGLKKIVSDILSSPPVQGYMPYEFTCAGMLERVFFLVEKQNFCDQKNSWPPLSALKTFVSEKDTSCGETCSKHGCICEPHFFTNINQRSTFKALDINCEQFLSPSEAEEEVHYPSFNNKTCYLQSNDRLFSCAGQSTYTRRLCPCRDFIKQQVALCKDCLTT